MSKEIFISYSHKDKEILAELEEHIDGWDDRQIKPGSKWRNEIDDALQSCKVGVFILSPAFWRSKFITQVELPELMRRSNEENITILFVEYISFGKRYKEENPEIQDIQWFNKDNPIKRMRKNKKHDELVRLSDVIYDILKKYSSHKNNNLKQPKNKLIGTP